MLCMLFCVCGEASSNTFLECVFSGSKVNTKPVLLYFTKFLSIKLVLFCSPTRKVCQCLCTHSNLRNFLHILWGNNLL